jgi:hypothetical protein
MDANGDDRRELFIFPDGTAVEVIVFDPAPQTRRVGPPRQRSAAAASAQSHADHAPDAPRAPAPFGTPEEHAPSACPLCDSDLLYPVDWARNNQGDWNLRLRCPNCETQRHIILRREGVEALNRTLYLRAQALAREADTVSRTNFEEEAAKLVEALYLDLILPMDF